MKDLEKIVNAEKKYFNFINKENLAAVMIFLLLGLYSGNANANAELGYINDKNGAPVRIQVYAGQIYENNKVIGQAREDGRANINPSNANRFHSTPIMTMDKTYENYSSTSQVKSTQQQNIPTATFNIQSNPPGSDIFFDGINIGKTNYSGTCHVGNHTITVVRGKHKVSSSWNFGAGNSLRVIADFKNKRFLDLNEVERQAREKEELAKKKQQEFEQAYNNAIAHESEIIEGNEGIAHWNDFLKNYPNNKDAKNNLKKWKLRKNKYLFDYEWYYKDKYDELTIQRSELLKQQKEDENAKLIKFENEKREELEKKLGNLSHIVNNLYFYDYVVIDTKTCLMWTRDANIIGRVLRTREKVSEKTDNINFAGYGDWRLPTKEEFIEFVKLCGDKPYKYLSRIGFHNVQCNSYLTSSSSKYYISYSNWAVHLGAHKSKFGEDSTGQPTSYVWPVRDAHEEITYVILKIKK